MTEKVRMVSNTPKYPSEGLYLPPSPDNLLPHVQFRAQNIGKIQTAFSSQKETAHSP